MINNDVDNEENKDKKNADAYMLWNEDDEPDMRRGPMHIPAPKMILPGFF